MTMPSESPGALPVERYLPGIVLERLVAEAGARRSARSEPLRGAILYADIAGFTALTARRPIIGRAAELARVDTRLRRLGSGEGGVLLLEGEAGIGKSRLAAEAAERARALGFAVFTGHADATERSSAPQDAAGRRRRRPVSGNSRT